MLNEELANGGDDALAALRREAGQADADTMIDDDPVETSVSNTTDVVIIREASGS